MRALIALLALVPLCSSVAAQPRKLSHFPTAEEVLPTSRARELLEQARIDFERCRKRQDPKYARLWLTLRDGGSRTYTNTGYIVSTVRRLGGHPEKTGRFSLDEGASITFKSPITRGEFVYADIRHTP